MATGLLVYDNDMLERLEKDLMAKCSAAFLAAAVSDNVNGVFSVDDLENKSEGDLCKKVGVGVAYAGAEPTAVATNPKDPLNVGSVNAGKMIDYLFTIILAVPTGPDCEERYTATKLLTVLRRGIIGSKVAGDPVSRSWAFLKESPNIAQSTETLLYYTQVWRLALPLTGPSS